MPDNDILKTNNLSFKYGAGIMAVSDVTFSIKRGDFLAILGPNGSGKTTLLRLISGVLKPSEGEIFLQDTSIDTLQRKDIARKIAFVPQQIHIDFPFTVREIVLMGRFSYLGGIGIEKKEDIEIARDSMEMTGISHLRDRMIHQISGGERQRAFIAQAITALPEILILDEPVSSLDIRYKVQILELISRLNSRNNITVIITLHDLNLASQYAKNVLLLNRGFISAEGSPESVLVPEKIRDVYDIDVNIIKSSDGKNSFIMPSRQRKTGRKLT